MCEKDGGARVNERVAVTSQYIDKDGNIRIPPNGYRENPFEWEAKPDDLFYYETEINEIKNGWLAVKQFKYKVIRNSDKKILGESISYGRVGGDFPSFGHPTYFTCPKNADSSDLIELVMQKPELKRDAK